MTFKKNFCLSPNILTEQLNEKLFWRLKKEFNSDTELVFASNEMLIRLSVFNSRNNQKKEFQNSVSSIESLIRISRNMIALGSDDKKIRIYDCETHRLISTLVGHNSSVKSLYMLKSGRLASGSHKTIKIWDLTQYACLKTLNGHTRTVLCLCQTESMVNEIVSGSWDATIKIWNWKIGICLRTLNGHSNSILCLSFINDTIISGSYDNKIKLWSPVSMVRTFKGHSLSVSSLIVLTTYTNLLISSSYDKTIKIWDITLGACLKTFFGHSKLIASIIVLPSCELFSGSFDNTIRYWDLNNGKCLKEIHNTLTHNIIQLALL